MTEKIWRYVRWSDWELIYAADHSGWIVVDLGPPHERYGCSLVWLCKKGA